MLSDLLFYSGGKYLVIKISINPETNRYWEWKALAMTNSTWREKNSLNQLIHTHRWRHCRLDTKVSMP